MKRPARKDAMNKRAKKLWNKHNSVTYRMLPRTGKLHWKNTLQYGNKKPQAQRNSRGANTEAQSKDCKIVGPTTW